MAMSKREKYLAIGVGGIVGLLGIQFIIGSIRSGLDVKQRKLDALVRKIEDHDKKLTDCALATKRLNDLKSKSLPKDDEAAKNQYQAWLQDVAKKTGMQNVTVDNPQIAGIKSDAFTAHKFALGGVMRFDGLIDLLHHYYDRDYLQRISQLKVTPMRDDPELVQIKLDTEVLSLKAADAKQTPSLASSGRVTKSLEEYRDEILSRNPFSPPNRAPKFGIASSVDVPRDSDWSLELKATDPDARHRVKYALLSDKPEGLRFSEDSGRLSWKPGANGNYELLVEAIDSGFPPKRTQQKITLRVVDPPAAPPVVEPPKFDIASQAYVSAILGGRDGNVVWIRTKTDANNNKIQAAAGDEISIGTVKGKIIEVNVEEQFVEIETDGRKWILDMDDRSLQAAFKKSQTH